MPPLLRAESFKQGAVLWFLFCSVLIYALKRSLWLLLGEWIRMWKKKQDTVSVKHGSDVAPDEGGRQWRKKWVDSSWDFKVELMSWCLSGICFLYPGVQGEAFTMLIDLTPWPHRHLVQTHVTNLPQLWCMKKHKCRCSFPSWWVKEKVHKWLITKYFAPIGM